MLTLTRRVGEEIVIQHPNIEPMRIKIIAANKGGRVRLGFEADRSIEIIRSELLDREKKPVEDPKPAEAV